VRSFPELAVQVRALWARHSTRTLPLSTQEYKWVATNCWENLANCGEMTYDGLTFRPEGVGILLTPSCYKNRDKLSLSHFASNLYLFFFDQNPVITSCNRLSTFHFYHCRNREFFILRHAFLNIFNDTFIFIYLFLTKSFIPLTLELLQNRNYKTIINLSFILLEHYNDKIPGVLEGYSTL